jgi:parallel beta-helix repeat protein
MPSVFTVTTTADAGTGSLRQAILDANAHPGTDTIAFDIGAGGVQTIRPTTPLPTITVHVVIDGTTQPGFAGSPLIVLNGSDTGTGANGLTMTAGFSTVQALVIDGFAGDGIVLDTNGSNVIAGNYIGTDVTGTLAVGNGADGLAISSSNNLVGGTTAGARNLISGNHQDGVDISDGSGDVLSGNYFGTDVTGTHPLANLSAGVSINRGSNHIVGGTVAGARNLISGNADGIDMFGNGHALVQGNSIGTDVTGTIAVPNIRGVFDRTGSNTYGGTLPGAGNLISGNLNNGMELDVGNSLVQGNRIGTDLNGMVALGNSGVGIALTGTSHTIGGTVAGAGNLISGNPAGGVEIFSGGGNVIQGNYLGTDASGTRALPNFAGIFDGNLGSGSNTIGGTVPGAGNLISGNQVYGILLSSGGNTVQGNFIGTNAIGTAPVANAGVGAVVLNGSGNLIGGTAVGAGNLVSGNLMAGLLVSGSRNIIQGNRIGTDSSGSIALANGTGLSFQGTDNTVGGTVAGSGNVISGNSGDGVHLEGSGNLVAGNLIGTDVTGTRPLGNTDGVHLIGGNNTIGGTTSQARNLLSGNRDAGILASAGNGDQVQGNFIGTGLDGTVALGIQQFGLYVQNAAITVGGTAAGAGNLISGNVEDGANSSGGRIVVQDNLIGTDVTGTRALGNGRNGVLISGGNLSTIGGTTSAARNVISGNNLGVLIDDSFNLVEGNYIGTDVTGAVALPNRSQGVQIGFGQHNTVGGTEAGAGNLISGNSGDGIDIVTAANVVQGNLIGTDVTGTHGLGNHRDGVRLQGFGNTIGGVTDGAGNLISGNAENGVDILSGTDDLVQGNYIGTDITGTIGVSNNFHGVFIGSNNNLVGGTAHGARNLISANLEGGIIISSGSNNVVAGNFIGTDAAGTHALSDYVGVFIVNNSHNNLVGGTAAGAGNLISGSDTGVFLADSGNVVQGNLIGTDVTGTQALGNAVGVSIDRSSNTVGGPAPGARNIISGNTYGGVQMAPATGNVVQGNYIGTDITGTQALGNGNAGVTISGGANNTVGGTAAGAGNLVSGNPKFGISIEGSSGNVVQGNLIGTDVTGTQALGNSVAGVNIYGGGNNTIGGTLSGAGNLISGNGSDGVYIISNSSGNVVQGNYIGTNVTGTQALGNGNDGVNIFRGANNTLGGTAPGAGNLVSGNRNIGISIGGSSGNVVQGNYIGTNVTGTQALGNSVAGVNIYGGGNNTIGGTLSGAGNLVSGNGSDGVYIVTNSSGNVVQGNKIGTDVTGTQALSPPTAR